MTRQELEHFCQPLTPKQVLSNLRQLYDVLSNWHWAEVEELEALNACIEVLKAIIKEAK